MADAARAADQDAHGPPSLLASAQQSGRAAAPPSTSPHHRVNAPYPAPETPSRPRPGLRRPEAISRSSASTAAGTSWLLLATTTLTVAASAAAAAAVTCRSAVTCPVDTTKLSLTGINLGQAAVAILAVLAISSEYRTGMIHITLAAMPRRSAVLAAKAAILTG